MKKNLLHLFLATLFLGISFTSCRDDGDYITRGSLNSKFLLTSNRDGYFATSLTEFRLSDIANINSSRNDIVGIDLYDSWIDINGNFRINDQIRSLKIYVPNVGTYFFPTPYIVNDPTGITIDGGNAPGYFRFMQDVMSELNYRGRISVQVSGFVLDRRGLPVVMDIDVILNNDLDVRVRD